MKILLTGGTGFVGKNLLNMLEKNHDVNILSRKKIDKKNVYVGDLSDKNLLLEASKVDVVVHLAGITKGDVFKVNFEGTKNLVDASLKNKVKKFIFISSYEMLNDSNYGKSKLKAEEYIKNSGIKYIIFRPSVIYGVGENKDINKLADLMKKFRIAPIPGNGKYKLQPLFVDDLVDVIIKSINSNKINEEYFIAGPNEISFNELVNIIEKTINKKCLKIHIPKFIVKIINKSLLKDKICDLSKIKKDFNVNLTGFESGILYLRHDF